VAPAPRPDERVRTNFEDLPGADGKRHSLSELAGQRATVLVFTSNGCPTARSYEDRLMRLQRRWRARGVQLVAINSNNPHLSPADTLEEMARRSAMRCYNFPYLKDADGAVARSYGAVCTPHAIVLDGAGTIVYSGRIDDSRTGTTINNRDLEAAVSNVIAGRPVPVQGTEPFGCSIVW
jgi:peroxiredoxin